MTIHASDRRPFGRTGLEVTAMGFGASPLGNFQAVIPERDCAEMLDAAWDAGLRLFDTSPLYGHGLSEWRCGAGLRGRPRDEYVLSTKVGRLLRPGAAESTRPWVDVPPFHFEMDYGYDAAMRSIEDSLQRMGVSRIDVALIHDVDVTNLGVEMQKVHFRTAMGGAARALFKLRDEGVLRAVGFGVNEWEPCEQALREADFDCFLLAGQYSLLLQESLESFLPLCVERGVAILLGGVFHGGILAIGARPGAKFCYRPAPPEIMARTAAIEAVCARHGVKLGAAAIQFPLAHPAIPTVVLGHRNLGQLERNIALMQEVIPGEFWADLKHEGLLREDAPTPG